MRKRTTTFELVATTREVNLKTLFLLHNNVMLERMFAPISFKSLDLAIATIKSLQ